MIQTAKIIWLTIFLEHAVYMNRSAANMIQKYVVIIISHIAATVNLTEDVVHVRQLYHTTVTYACHLYQVIEHMLRLGMLRHFCYKGYRVSGYHMSSETCM